MLTVFETSHFFRGLNKAKIIDLNLAFELATKSLYQTVSGSPLPFYYLQTENKLISTKQHIGTSAALMAIPLAGILGKFVITHLNKVYEEKAAPINTLDSEPKTVHPVRYQDLSSLVLQYIYFARIWIAIGTALSFPQSGKRKFIQIANLIYCIQKLAQPKWLLFSRPRSDFTIENESQIGVPASMKYLQYSICTTDDMHESHIQKVATSFFNLSTFTLGIIGKGERHGLYTLSSQQDELCSQNAYFVPSPEETVSSFSVQFRKHPVVS